ncbi:hypothetical protein D3C73_1665960 [compost metagenome]
MIDQTVDILHKSTDDTHACDIMNVLLHILYGELMALALHLLQNALGFLDA